MLAKLHLYLVCLFIMGGASSSFGQGKRPGSVPRDGKNCEETEKPGYKPKSRFLQGLLANDPHGLGKLGKEMGELKESLTPPPGAPSIEEKLDKLSNRLRKFNERFFPEEEVQEEKSPFTPQKPITDNDIEKPSKPPIVLGGEPLPTLQEVDVLPPPPLDSHPASGRRRFKPGDNLLPPREPDPYGVGRNGVLKRWEYLRNQDILEAQAQDDPTPLSNNNRSFWEKALDYYGNYFGGGDKHWTFSPYGYYP